MGGKDSKPANSSSASASATASATGRSRVLINVYKPTSSTITIPGFGIYHSGVELFDSEYYYGGADMKLSGVEVQRPRSQPVGSQWTFDQTLDLGECPLSREDIRTMISEMKSEFPANDYHLTNRNCNHFSAAVCDRLGVKFPSWINRAANVANPFKSLAGNSVKPPNEPEFDGIPITQQHKENLTLEKIENQELLTSGLIDIKRIGGLNANQNHPIHTIFQLNNRINEKYYIESDNDSQLLLFIPMICQCKLVGIQFQLSIRKENQLNQPKLIKFYINQSNIDFNDCNENVIKPIQSEELKLLNEIREDSIGSLKEITKNPQSKQEFKQGLITIHIPLKGALFHSVSYLTIFIESNHGADTTKLYGLDFFGRPADKK